MPDVGAVGVTPDKRYRKRLVSGGPRGATGRGPRAGAGEGLSCSLPPPAASPPAPRAATLPPHRGPLPLPAAALAPLPPTAPALQSCTPPPRQGRGGVGGCGAAWVGGGAGIIAMAGRSSATLPTLRSQSRRASPSPWGAPGPVAWLLPRASGTPGGGGPRLEWSEAANAVGTLCQHPRTAAPAAAWTRHSASPWCTGMGPRWGQGWDLDGDGGETGTGMGLKWD